jgi:Serine carboxypeptidase
MMPTSIQLRQQLSAVVTFAVGLYLVVGAADARMPIAAEAGFSELEPIGFSFQREGPTLRYTSSRARVFYNFQPADHDATAKPLFVFLNGGPGCPTCEGLLSTNTGHRSVYIAPWGPTPFLDTTSPNPYSWTHLGNLLYIDAPTTGYSYNLADGTKTGSETAVFYDAQNFNSYIDAAQMVRVVLRFLRAHPNIAKNPVVLVGESYGGTRVSTMLNLLLNYQRYGSGPDVYRDVGLTREVQGYLDKHFF